MVARCTHAYLRADVSSSRGCALGLVARCKAAVVVRSAGRMDVDRDRRAAEWDGGLLRQGKVRTRVCVCACLAGRALSLDYGRQ